ncbi:hypothetical protein CIK90_11535 [Prevotella sp. P5-126]|uniref:fimbrillin family protein n=1 Tax=Prevotella sp. P5-126 TaxID=2024216 RepID=UPI000B972AA3|nr:fimbrillin family protein [Prevotella sp. P5-126]OYP35580.1 hypothetical protein CIK90_11535 [Prevotella sp. P5-126]
MKHILYILLVAIAFAACSTDTLLETEKMPMEISVDVASFAGKTQDVSTRASVNNGIYTTFAEGDDLGVFVVDKDGNIVANNLRYVVAKTGNAYPVDDSGNIVASKIYYDPGCTYFAYAPYDAQYTGCKSVEEIKQKYTSVFNTKYADQSTPETYCAADLLICDKPEWTAPRMRFFFTHAMSLLQVFYNGDYKDLTIEAPVELCKMFLPKGKSTYRYVTLPKNEVQIYGMALSRHTDDSEAPSYSFWQTKVDMKENSAILISISSQPTESYKTAGVDMGFPSGCIWAAYNLGSESAANQTTRGGKWYDAYGKERTDLMSNELHKSFDRGDYYSWGELETKYEQPAVIISKEGKVTAVGDALTANASEVTSFISGSEKGYYPGTYIDRTYSYSPIDGNIAGSEYDVVRNKLWKGEWRIPNENEIDELMRNSDISVYDWYYEDNVRYAPWIAEKNDDGTYKNLHQDNSEFYGTDSIRPFRYLVVIYKFKSKINGEELYIPGGTWSDWSIDELSCRSRNAIGNYHTTTSWSEDYGGMYYFASSASHSDISCASYMEMEANRETDKNGYMVPTTPRIKSSTYKDKNGNTVTLMGLTQNGHRYTGMLIRPVYGGKNWNTNTETRGSIRITVE